MNTLQALSDPTRQRIVEMLVAGALSSGEIARRFELSAPAVSQHLKALRTARLVSVRAEKQRRIYQLDPEGVSEMVSWVEKIKAFWNPRLDALEVALASSSEAIGHKKNLASNSEAVDHKKSKDAP